MVEIFDFCAVGMDSLIKPPWLVARLQQSIFLLLLHISSWVIAMGFIGWDRWTLDLSISVARKGTSTNVTSSTYIEHNLKNK